MSGQARIQTDGADDYRALWARLPEGWDMMNVSWKSNDCLVERILLWGLQSMTRMFSGGEGELAEVVSKTIWRVWCCYIAN